MKGNRECDAVHASAAQEVAAGVLGECSGCSEKESRIEELKEEVESLKRRLQRYERI
jgi:hypothetical protein